MNKNKNRINHLGETEEQFLNNYNPGNWDKASITTDIANFTVMPDKNGVQCLNILLIKRGNHPDIGSWALPGGFMDMDESLEDSALRELKEETGVSDVFLMPVREFSNPSRDKRMRVVTFAYMALIESRKALAIKAGDDASDAAWFTIRRRLINNLGNSSSLSLVLENEDLGIKIEYVVMEKVVKNGKIKEKKKSFRLLDSSTDYLMSDHAEILDEALRKLRIEIEMTPIAFNLLPDLFTITDTMSIYEAIWGRNLPENHEDFNEFTKGLDKSNFTRMIKKYILDTGKEKSHNKSGPAPKLYTLKNDY